VRDPVVASEVGGLMTLVDPGVTGLLVATRDASAWADAVETVVDPEHVTAMSNAAFCWRGPTPGDRPPSRWPRSSSTLTLSGLVRC